MNHKLAPVSCCWQTANISRISESTAIQDSGQQCEPMWNSVMKFLVFEGIKHVTYKTLQAQYGDETLSHGKTFERHKRFKSFRKGVIFWQGCAWSI